MKLNLFKKKETPFLLTAPTCNHNWNLFAKTYAAPKPASDNIPEVFFERIVLGVTTYLWECLNCSLIRKEESLGSDENQLVEVLDKAEKLGIQYVTYNGKKFGIAIVPMDEGKIPIK